MFFLILSFYFRSIMHNPQTHTRTHKRMAVYSYANRYTKCIDKNTHPYRNKRGNTHKQESKYTHTIKKNHTKRIIRTQKSNSHTKNYNSHSQKMKLRTTTTQGDSNRASFKERGSTPRYPRLHEPPHAARRCRARLVIFRQIQESTSVPMLVPYRR